jgi:putative ABC transport system ATP-binding protein
MNNCLSVRNLRLSRTKNDSTFTLLVPKLDLFTGKTLAVVGQSGCGKSTLTDILALVLKPDSAERFIMRRGQREINLFTATRREQADIRGRDIGYVLQSGGLFPFLSVRENIMLPGSLLGMDSRTVRTRAVELARAMGIADQLNKKPQFLSGGQRQRVAIARALIHKPGLVLADEPTAAVDSVSAEDICKLLKATVIENEASLLIVSHDRNLMHKYADDEVTFRLERSNGITSTLIPGK